jgi:hypothetical protein
MRERRIVERLAPTSFGPSRSAILKKCTPVVPLRLSLNNRHSQVLITARIDRAPSLSMIPLRLLFFSKEGADGPLLRASNEGF